MLHVTVRISTVMLERFVVHRILERKQLIVPWLGMLFWRIRVAGSLIWTFSLVNWSVFLE